MSGEVTYRSITSRHSYFAGMKVAMHSIGEATHNMKKKGRLI